MSKVKELEGKRKLELEELNKNIREIDTKKTEEDIEKIKKIKDFYSCTISETLTLPYFFPYCMSCAHTAEARMAVCKAILYVFRILLIIFNPQVFIILLKRILINTHNHV